MALKLEVFETSSGAGQDDDTRSSALEEERLAAFEKGYAAGWEDGTTAEMSGQQRIRTELAHQLQELSFTWHEARAQALHDLGPLIQAMAGKVLPQIARAALGPLVAEAVTAFAAHGAEVPLIIRVSPADEPALSDFLAQSGDPPLSLVADDTLSEGQVWLRAADAEEAMIDLGKLEQDILRAVHNHFHIEPEKRRHG